MTKKLMSQLKEFKELLAVFLLFAGLFSGASTVCWAKVIVPKIDKRIEEKQKPIEETQRRIIEVLERQCFVMEATLSDSLKKEVDEKYKRSQRNRIEKKETVDE